MNFKIITIYFTDNPCIIKKNIVSKYCLLTNDVETHSIWFNTLRDETGVKVLEEGMPLLLEIYKKFNIKSTFYFVGDMAEKFPDVVKMILPYGHEVASHGWTHEVDQAFDVLTFDPLYRYTLYP